MDGDHRCAGPETCAPVGAPGDPCAHPGCSLHLADIANDFDRIADLPVHRWDHNRCYYSLMLRELP